MAKKKKKKQGSPASAGRASEKEKKSFSLSALYKKMSLKMRRILCISLLACITLGAALGGFLYYRAHAGYNYIEADLARYVTIDIDKFDDIALALSIDKPTQKDVEREIVKLQLEYMQDSDVVIGGDPLNDAVALGSKVRFYYVGYTVLQNGMREYFSGGSNLEKSAGDEPEPSETTIGEGNYLLDLEEGMIGVRPVDTELPQITLSGTVEEGDTVYVDIVGFHTDGTGINSYRHPLVVTPALDDIYGEGFYELLLGSKLGRSVVSGVELLDSKTDPDADFLYTTVRPQFKAVGGVSHTVPVTFPSDYKDGSPLNGKEAFFEVYIVGTTSYRLPEMTDAFLTDTVEVLPSKLEPYEGETLVEKYRSFVWEELLADYETRHLTAAEESFWVEIKKIASVKNVPRAAVNEEYDIYMADLESTYTDYLENMGITKKDYSFKTFTKEYFPLADGESYRSRVRSIAKQTAEEKMIFFYAMEFLGVSPSAEELSAAFEESLLELAKQYNLLDESYYEDDTKTIEEREAAYAEYLVSLEETKQKLLETAGEEYFYESAYYNYGFPKLLSMVHITYLGTGHD